MAKLKKYEERRLRVFVRKADELLSSNIFSKGEADKLSSGANLVPGKGIEFHASLPDEIELEQLFRRFRPFFLKKEPSNFHSVCNLMLRCLNSILKDKVQKAQKRYERAMGNTGPVEINFIGKSSFSKLKAEEVINLWYNAHYFHSDEDKEKQLQELNTVLSESYTKNIVVISILLAGYAIALLRDVIKSSDLVSL